MKNKLILVAVILLWNLNFAAYSQTTSADSLSLSDAIERAMEENHEIAISKNLSLIDEINATIGNAGYFPSLSLNSSASRSIENTQLRLSDGSTEQESEGSVSDQYSASADLDLTLFDGFGNYYRLQNLRNSEELGSTESRLEIENTLLDVIQNYLEIIASRQLTDVNEQIIDVSEERYRRAEQQFEKGGQTRVDLLNAQVALNQDSIRYVQSESDLNQQKRDLQVLLGDDPGSDITVNPDISINKNLDLQQLTQQALQSNASVLSARLRADQAQLSLKETKSNRYPEITAQSSYSYNRSESDADFVQFQETDGFSAGINFQFNIFNGFQQSVSIQSDEIRLKNSEEEEELAEKEIRKEIQNAYEEYSTNLYLLEKQELNVETAELNFERTEEAFELGQVSNTEFREAQLNLLEANQELIDLEINAKLSEVQLLQLSGQLLDQE